MMSDMAISIAVVRLEGNNAGFKIVLDKRIVKLLRGNGTIPIQVQRGNRSPQGALLPIGQAELRNEAKKQLSVIKLAIGVRVKGLKLSGERRS